MALTDSMPCGTVRNMPTEVPKPPDPLSVECRHCGAAPLAACVFQSSHVAPFHSLRRRDANQLRPCASCGEPRHRSAGLCWKCVGFRDREHARRRRTLPRSRARRAVTEAIKAGKIKRPLYCSECREGVRHGRPIEAHHPDYSKPLDVVFLCRSCHIAEHRRLRREARAQKVA